MSIAEILFEIRIQQVLPLKREIDKIQPRSSSCEEEGTYNIRRFRRNGGRQRGRTRAYVEIK